MQDPNHSSGGEFFNPLGHILKSELLENLYFTQELKKRRGDLSSGRSRLQEEVDSVGDLEDRLERLRKENANKKSALEAMQSKVKSKNAEVWQE